MRQHMTSHFFNYWSLKVRSRERSGPRYPARVTPLGRFSGHWGTSVLFSFGSFSKDRFVDPGSHPSEIFRLTLRKRSRAKGKASAVEARAVHARSRVKSRA